MLRDMADPCEDAAEVRVSIAATTDSIEQCLTVLVGHVEQALRTARNIRSPVSFLEAQRSSPEELVVTWDTILPRLSKNAFEFAMLALQTLIEKPDVRGSRDLRTSWERLLERERKRRLSDATSLLAAAATRHGVLASIDGTSRLILGSGNRQKRFYLTSDATCPFVAVKIASDRRLAARLIAIGGGVSPPQAKAQSEGWVRTFKRSFAELALRSHRSTSLCSLSIPSDQGEVISRLVSGPGRSSSGSDLIVEGRVSGEEHHLAFVGGKLITAVKCCWPTISGDGKTTIGHLLKDLLKGRAGDTGALLRRFEHMLRALSLAFETVLAQGAKASFRLPTDQFPTVDVTRAVHSDHAAAALKALNAFGLETGGVSFLVADISRPASEGAGQAIEIEPAPRLGLYRNSSSQGAWNIATAIAENAFPDVRDSHVSALMIIGKNGTQAIARRLGRDLSKGRVVGLALKSGVEICGGADAGLATSGDINWLAARLNLDLLVAATNQSRIRSRGLGIRSVDAVSILDRSSTDEAREVIAALSNASPRVWIVNADDAIVRQYLPADARMILVCNGAATEEPVESVASVQLSTIRPAKPEIVLSWRGAILASERIRHHLDGVRLSRTMHEFALRQWMLIQSSMP
jgi:hypothetical protein